MDGDDRPGWRWSNVPIPEPHVAGLIVGTIIHVLEPLKVVKNRRRARALGAELSGGGLLLIWWAVWTVGDVDVEKPATLVTTGPYAFSRNPMYVGWNALYLGLALLLNTLWLIVSFPIVVVASHWIIQREEGALERKFGDVYRTYKRDVPRYL